LQTGLMNGFGVQMRLLQTLPLLFQRERMLMKFLLQPLQQQLKRQCLREHHLNLLLDLAPLDPAAATNRQHMIPILASI